MAATVVSVVIFLLGVFVGRGVRTERSIADNATPASSVAETSPAPAPAAQTPPPAAADPTAVTPPKEAPEDLSYFSRLDKPNAPAEKLKPAPEKKKEEPPPPAPKSTPA